MTTVDKYLKEANEKMTIKQWAAINPEDANKLRDAYYGVVDHIEKLANATNVLTGDTGEFGKDLKLAVQARDAFRKITLGKYL